MQIALLPNNDARDGFGSGIIQDFVMDSLDHVERVARGDRVYEHVTVNADGMFRIEDGIFVLTGCVDDVAVVFLTSVGDGFLEDVFDGRVVGIDECVFYVSDDQRGLACEG